MLCHLGFPTTFGRLRRVPSFLIGPGETLLKSAQCRFESDWGHGKGAGHVGFKGGLRVAVPATSEGGIYMPRAPRVDPPTSGVGASTAPATQR